MIRSIALITGIFCSLIAQLAHAEPVHIQLGATLPLTGRLSFAGEDIKRGIELAIEETSTPEVRFTAIFDDNQHEARLAAGSAQKLLEVEKVDAIVSMWDMADVVAPLAERRKVPHISIRWDPGVAERYSQTMTVESTYRSWVDSTLKLLSHEGAKSVVVFTEEGQGWILASEYLKTKAADARISLLAEERFQGGAGDFRAIVLKGLRHKPDFVLLFSNPPTTENLVTSLKRLAPQQRFTGYFEVVQDLSLIEGAPFVAQFDVTPWFAERFKQRYGELPKTRAAQGYDIVKLLAKAAVQTRMKPTTANLAAAVREGSLPGAAGPLFLTGDKTIESGCVWKVARAGVLERLTPLTAVSGKEPTAAGN